MHLRRLVAVASEGDEAQGMGLTRWQFSVTSGVLAASCSARLSHSNWRGQMSIKIPSHDGEADP